MAKGKTATVFFCQNCGYESTKWLGQCPGCREWNTFVEETIDKTELKNTGNGAKRDRREASEPCVLSEIAIREENKTLTGIKELDRVLGGGIVQGSLTLVGGDPGIGKSTLLLQVCHNLSTAGHKVLYISGEESKVQIKMRADRLGTFSEHMLLLCETNLDVIQETILKYKPEVVIIDYGKYRYELARKEKEAKKKQKTIEVKEVRLSPNIDSNDLNTKIASARKFIEKGNKVKVTLRFRGREMAHVQSSRHILDEFAKALEDIALVDKPAKMEGRSMAMFLTEKRS